MSRHYNAIANATDVLRSLCEKMAIDKELHDMVMKRVMPQGATFEWLVQIERDLSEARDQM